jgi:hypothetical protein
MTQNGEINYHLQLLYAVIIHYKEDKKRLKFKLI